MLVVKIEIWPRGDKTQARDIGLILVSNDGQGDKEQAAYDVVVSHGGKYWGKTGKWKRGKVENFRRTLSPYHLVARALAACGIR